MFRRTCVLWRGVGNCFPFRAGSLRPSPPRRESGPCKPLRSCQGHTGVLPEGTPLVSRKGSLQNWGVLPSGKILPRGSRTCSWRRLLQSSCERPEPPPNSAACAVGSKYARPFSPETPTGLWGLFGSPTTWDEREVHRSQTQDAGGRGGRGQVAGVDRNVVKLRPYRNRGARTGEG